MSEPVGNGPRTPESSPGNTLRDRAKTPASAPEPKEAPEKLDKVIAGTATTRKQPWWKRAGRSMVAEDATSIREYLLTDVLVPAVKNLIYDTITGAAGRGLYGTSRVGQNAGGPRMGLRTRYDQVGSNDRGEPRKMLSREARANHDFGEVVLDTHEEAVMVVNNLIERLQRYNSVSVADLYDLVGVTGSFADQRWGWRNLDHADVRQVRGGFLLDLPRPEPLR